MPVTVEDLFQSPDHYFHSFQDDLALFVPMDRAAYHRSIFLDRRISPAGPGQLAIPFARLAPTPAAAATGWIFHVAHCGSTLLARALDKLSANLVLREPMALRQTALAPDDARLKLVLAMLGKRYRSDAPTLVKANVPVNFLLPELAVAAVGAQALFLHCDLRDYLLAILRSQNHRRWLANVTAQLAARLGDLSALADAERAAALWAAQRRLFAEALDRLPGSRALDAEVFYASPARAVFAAARHFSIPLDEDEVANIVAGPIFSTYSKMPDVAFDNAARLERKRALEMSLAGELARAEDWIERMAADADACGRALAEAALID